MRFATTCLTQIIGRMLAYSQMYIGSSILRSPVPVLVTVLRILFYFSLRLLSFQLLFWLTVMATNRLSVQGTLYPWYSSLPGINMAPKEIASWTFAWLKELKEVFASGFRIENMWLHQHYWILFGDIVSIVPPDARAPMSLFTSEYTLCPWLSMGYLSGFLSALSGIRCLSLCPFFSFQIYIHTFSSQDLRWFLLILALWISGFGCIWALSLVICNFPRIVLAWGLHIDSSSSNTPFHLGPRVYGNKG